MPYAQFTLPQLVAQVASLLDDNSNVYWTAAEVQYALWEGLRVWGALTNYWRGRASFNLTPGTPWVDLSQASAQLQALRTRTWTLQQLTQEIQFALLEAPNGISGTGMSGQVSITDILNAIQRTRNRFVLDVRFPLAVHSLFAGPPPPQGTFAFDQSSVFVHRCAWQDLSGAWTTLWRQDLWAADHANYQWTLQTGTPQLWSEAELAPLQLQLSPNPRSDGQVEALTVDSLLLNLTNPNQTFNVPDEWVHALKYGALAEILSADSQINDPQRAAYCEQRYQQAVTFARDAQSLIRLLWGNATLPTDSLQSLDAGQAYWRNQVGMPQIAAVLYDWLGVVNVPDQAYGMTAEVVQTAPLPPAVPVGQPTDYVQIGSEDLTHILAYVTHVLLLKCGGDEFQASMGAYDAFMEAVSKRKAINAAKIRYMEPLFGMAQREWAARPDRLEVNRA